MKKEVTLIVRKLLDHDYEAFYVGGFVRDRILGIKSDDIDIVTNARPDELLKLFCNHDVKLLEKEFSTVILIDDIDVATYRKDRYFGGGDKDVNITYSDTLDEDLARRDLTINAMAMNPETGEIIDLFGGRKDLERGIIRLVGNPHDRVVEDPNRIIRACRFQAKIQGIIDSETFIVSRNFMKDNFDKIKKERIKKEIFKVMTIKNASVFFKSLHALEILSKIFPALDKCYNMDHGKYHKEDVFTHSMLCGDVISTKFPLLKLTAYLHDCGKSEAFQDTEEGRSFIEHEYVGCDLLKEELKNLKFSNNEIKYITSMTKYHMRGIKQASPKAIRRLLVKLNNSNLDYRDLLRIKIADRIANLNKDYKYTFGDIRGFLLKYRKEINRESEKSFMKLYIDGNIIMEITGLKPGKIIGKIKKELEDLVLENPDLNDREYLSNYVNDKKMRGEYNEN